MTYIATISITSDKKHSYPFDIPAIKYARDIVLDRVTFFIGDNGTGKSTLLETIAFHLQLPHIDGTSYSKASFQAAKKLNEYLEITWTIDRPTGFFFRAEDFGDLLNSIDREDQLSYLNSLKGELSDAVIQRMKENASMQRRFVRKNFGQDLQTFSHGEAYLQIMHQTVKDGGIYILDEPEAALSPSRQLSLIYFMIEHLKTYQSQFIIATHSPILMAFPEAIIYEIDQQSLQQRMFEDTEHYQITKTFLENPQSYLRHLEC